MISAIYACMDREENLVSSLKSWINTSEITEFIIVDWSCDIPLINIKIITDIFELSNKQFHIIRVENQEYFSLSKAYNLGIKYAKNNIILKLDCDYLNLDNSWLKFLPIKNLFLDKCFVSGHYNYSGDRSLSGFLMINKTDFIGYNENLLGWGYDDIDLYNRLKQNNLTQLIFFLLKKYVKHIDHSDYHRTKNYPKNDIMATNKQNKIISEQKNLKFCQYDKLDSNEHHTVLIEHTET
jgi:predicted glycosyltransferase involved in capsule biosynthesis